MNYNYSITNKQPFFIIMRKIETQMNLAIKSQKNWSSGNTQVITDNGFSRVFLHGNHIANVFDDVVNGDVKKVVQLFDGGWQTVTTKSRLNALLDEFATGFSVFQKNWEWFVSDFQGKNIVDFDNGISISD